MDDVAGDPRAFYDEYGRSEWERLGSGIDGRLEFEETVAALEADLPDEGHVLDAGGGAGRYAVWLAERGHDVTLLDLSRRQLEVAREAVAERGLGSRVSLVQGSITDLGLPADVFDATCCLGGALSHVLDPDARQQAVRELRRASTPGAPLFASVIGQLGFLQLCLTTGTYLSALPEVLDGGDCTADLLRSHGYEPAFADAHYFRRAELSALLSDAGVSVQDVVGLEGLASLHHDAGLRAGLDDASEAELAALERTVRETNDDPAVADLSIHLLAIGRA